jgi:outer membrane receptor protein involved in Fe transport
MRKILTALAVVFLASSVFAQGAAITGVVTDESGGTLPGATVVVSGPGGSRTGFTGSDGKFSIVPAGDGPYKVQVSMPSFASQNKDGVAAGANLPFSLKIAGLGETVVVSASKVESTLANAPVTMSVVTAATLATAPSQNFGDILRNVPGVNVIQTSARDVNLSMRQGTSTLATSTLVLLDGRSLYLDFFGLVLWDLVPSNPSDIKQIEVVRGPASAVWGANALTGVVNILTKTPRENPSTSMYVSAGTFGTKGGSRESSGSGTSFGAGISFAKAINDTWSTRLSAGYFNSDPFSRPIGSVPVIQDPRVTTTCSRVVGSPGCIGGAAYPVDTATGNPGTSFSNDGSKQPKFDARFDQDMSNGGRVSYSAGYAGTSGIIHTGIGPFDMQSGAYLGYGRIGYTKGAFKVAAFANKLDVEAPNLLLTDPGTGRPVALNFKTNTYDFEVGHSKIVAEKHVFSYGGNARQNKFDITLAPGAGDRNEFGAYLQDEFFVDKFRLTVGGRVDKFGNIDKAVFSPRVTAMFKPAADQSLRLSFNKAFRAPSAINNYLSQKIFAPVAPINLNTPQIRGAIQLFAPAAAVPLLLSQIPATPINLIVNNVGNPNLKEESVTAYEVAYTGTFNDKTTFGVAVYRNETDNNINFSQVTPSASFPRGGPFFDVYTADATASSSANCCAPTGIPAQLYGFMMQIAPTSFPLPRTVSTYLNLGPLQQDGVELSIDHRVNNDWSISANYSYQAKPKVLDAKSGQIKYLTEELALPAKNRFNASVNWNGEKFVGTLQANYQDKALWTDVLSSTYHGYTESFTMVNANIGMKWNKGKVVTTLKGMNLLDKKIQQHVYGDILRRSVTLEARFSF